MSELEAEKATLEERLASAPEPAHPAAAPKPGGTVPGEGGGLEDALADTEIKADAVEVIRSQINRITLTPNDQGTLDIQLHRDLAHILEFCEAAEEHNDKRPGRGEPGRELSVVAGHDLDFVHFSYREGWRDWQIEFDGFEGIQTPTVSATAPADLNALPFPPLSALFL